jgi:hypothetical protein
MAITWARRHAGASTAALLLLCVASVDCGGRGVNHRKREVHHIADVGAADRAVLAGKRIYFGHQSVGANIVEGLAELERAHPKFALRIVGADGADSGSGGFFAQALVGTNGRPASKTEAFAAVMNGPLGSRLDIAFHKYCFVDVTERTDVDRTFRDYRDAMARLRTAFPSVVFVHVTTPVTTVQTGPKAWMKRLLGRAPAGYRDNLNRQRFNDLMRREYRGSEPLFDLAAVESTSPGGDAEDIVLDGERAEVLYPPFASDGAHLNVVGRQRVAEELLVFLAGVVPSR